VDKIIEVNNLVKKFGSFVANDNLTFHVEKGEIFGFLGANGAGKTTAMKILCGLSKPTSGRVMVAGNDVALNPEKVKSSIGYMSQKFSLYDDLSVVENLRLFGTIYRLSRRQIQDRTRQTLSRLNLYAERNRLINTFSLGWKQKLAFSSAILHRPRLVFLDEPTSGVDPVTRRQFWEMIYEAVADGITVFVTTHYMDEAEYCNRVTMMVDGKIEALDSPSALKQQYGVETMNDLFVKLARK